MYYWFMSVTFDVPLTQLPWHYTKLIFLKTTRYLFTLLNNKSNWTARAVRVEADLREQLTICNFNHENRGQDKLYKRRILYYFR